MLYMYMMYYLCWKDTIPLKHQYIKPFCSYNTTCQLKQHFPCLYRRKFVSMVWSKKAFSVSFLQHSSKLDHTICPDSLRLGGKKTKVGQKKLTPNKTNKSLLSWLHIFCSTGTVTINVPSKLRTSAAAKIPLRSCNNACKQCAVATKCVNQRTRLIFRAAL